MDIGVFICHIAVFSKAIAIWGSDVTTVKWLLSNMLHIAPNVKLSSNACH